uniref:G_PROTEIN_RECEP_F1_2 domain-containing protein n=1 Tax=Steinernema glaseri TaxID=37863 RepID=A0A1I7Y001_9BILA
MMVILIVGIFGNINIIMATVRKKHLKTKIHLMICTMSVMNTISICFEVISAIRMFLHIESMPRSSCFKFIWVYLVVFVSELIVGFAVALDRLVAVLYPMSYDKVSSYASIPRILFISFLVGAGPVIASVFYLDDEVLPVCNPPIVFPWEVYTYWNALIIIISLAILVTYTVVLRGMHRLEKVQINLRQLRITRILKLSVLTLACTKFSAVVITMVIPFVFSEPLRDMIATFCVLAVSIEYGINYWLLLIRKDDTYRRAFLEQLGYRKVAPKEAWVNESQVRQQSGATKTDERLG